MNEQPIVDRGRDCAPGGSRLGVDEHRDEAGARRHGQGLRVDQRVDDVEVAVAEGVGVCVDVGTGGAGVAVDTTRAVASTRAFAMACASASTVASAARSSPILASTVASMFWVGSGVKPTAGARAGAGSGVPPHADRASTNSAHTPATRTLCLIPVSITMPLGAV